MPRYTSYPIDLSLLNATFCFTRFILVNSLISSHRRARRAETPLSTFPLVLSYPTLAVLWPTPTVRGRRPARFRVFSDMQTAPQRSHARPVPFCPLIPEREL